MNDTFDIRPARRADLDGLLALYATLNPADPVLGRSQADAAFDRMLGHPGMTVFVGLLDGKAVSTCTLVVIPNLTRAAAPYALIENVVTAADHRKAGYGRRLLHAATQRAWDDGCYKVMLLTGKDDPATLHFYAQSGFLQDKTGFQIRRPAAAP